MTRTAWYRGIYSRPVYLRLYESIDRETAGREARSAVRLLGIRRPASVLDVACGFGRHVAELGRLGFRAAGFDLSQLLLNRAVKFARDQRQPANYVCADLRALPFCCAFDAAINFFLSFGYLSDRENLAALKEVAGALRPGAPFLLDTWNAAQVIASLQPRIVEEREDVVIVERSRYLPRTRRIEWSNEARFHTGERKTWRQSIRAYTPDEWRELFRAAGFVAVRLRGDWDGASFRPACPRLIIVARKSRR